jgi:hypothetical protein
MASQHPSLSLRHRKPTPMTRCRRPLSLADHFSASHHWSTPSVTGLSLTIFLGSLTEPAPSSSRHKSDRSPPVPTYRLCRGALSQQSSQIWRLIKRRPTHEIFVFVFCFWIYQICCGWVVNFLCNLLWIAKIFFWIVVWGFISGG